MNQLFAARKVTIPHRNTDEINILLLFGCIRHHQPAASNVRMYGLTCRSRPPSSFCFLFAGSSGLKGDLNLCDKTSFLAVSFFLAVVWGRLERNGNQSIQKSQNEILYMCMSKDITHGNTNRGPGGT